ncbi:MAG: DUF2723 domain-containing protein [Myxococcales bacterium]|nr:DUF2723 domain-containing protein [Myxococcales bacterium]
MREPAWRSALVFAAVGGFLAWTALPGLHWHDTGEFAAVAWRLSVSHSPGHPLHALTTRAVQEIPLGDGVFRAGIASALALAAALTVFYRLLRRLAPGAAWWTAAAMAVLPAVMPAIWLQGARAEVYALQLLLAAACGSLAWSVAEGDRRALPALGLAFGLAGANHHLVGLALLPMALLAVVAGRPSARGLALGVAGGLVGLLTYALLPLRALSGAEVGWGAPTSLAGVVEMITAREWVGANPATQAPLDLVENAQKLGAWTIEQVGLVGAALLLLSLGVGLVPALRARRGAVLGAAAAALGVGATKYFYPFDPLNPDVGGYLAAALCAGLALVFVCLAYLPRLRGWGTLVAVVCLALAAPGFDPGGRQGARAAERYGQAVLAAGPIDGVLVAGDYATWFQTWALRAVQGARPDLALVFRGREGADWLWTRLALHRPAIAALRPGWPASAVPVGVFEPGPRALPEGAKLALRGAVWARLPWPTPDLDTRRFLALHHLNQARALPAGSADAQAHFAAARSLVGDDPVIAEEEGRLGPGNALDAHRTRW